MFNIESNKFRLVIISAALVWCVLVFFGDPSSEFSLLPSCAFYKITGLYCTGCGATRALHALLHFDILEAMSQNVFFVCSIPMIAILLFVPKVAYNVYFLYVLLFLIVLFTVLRNFEIFSMLAPH